MSQRKVGFVKARLIEKLMAASSWAAADVLFVDDSHDHITHASSVCRTLWVTSKPGMQEPEFNAIRTAAGLKVAA